MSAADNERRTALRSYLTTCVAQHLLSLDDLDRPLSLMSKLGRTLFDDLRYMGKEMTQSIGAVASVKAAEGFLELAGKLRKRRR